MMDHLRCPCSLSNHVLAVVCLSRQTGHFVPSDGPFSRHVLAVVYQSSQTDGRRDSLSVCPVCHSLTDRRDRQIGHFHCPVCPVMF